MDSGNRMKSEEIRNKVVKGVLYNLSGTMAKHGVAFITSIFLSRRLEPADFGLIGMGMVFITFAQGFSDLGLTSGLIQKKNTSQSEMSTVFFFNIFTSTILTIILFFSSGLFAQYYKTPEIETIIKSISPLFILNSLNNVHNTILYKKLDVKLIRLSALISSILAGIVGVTLAYNDYGVQSLVISTYVSTLMNVFMIWSKSTWKPSLEFKWENINALIPNGIKAFLTNYLDVISGKIDVFIFGSFLSPAILGFYFRAQSLNLLVTKYSSQSLSGLFFPAIIKMENDKQEIDKFFTKSANVICFISFLLTGILYVIAEPLFILLFGYKWLTSVSYFKLLAFSSLSYPLSIVFNGVLLGTDNATKMLKLEVKKKLLNLLALLCGVMWGIEIYLWTLAFTNMLGIFMSILQIRNILNQKTIKYFTLILKYSLPLFCGVISIQVLENFFTFSDIVIKLFLTNLFFLTVYIGTCSILNLQGYLTIRDFLYLSIKKTPNIAQN
jgi:teichuronic acid exporter